MAKYLFIACLCCLLAAGCGSRERSSANNSRRPADRDESPEQIVRNAVESRTALSSIAGKGVMRIVDQPSKFGLTVNADVVADGDENRLRIKADKLAGAIQAFDVAMLGDDIGFYIPTQNTLYHGKVRDLQNFSFRFAPDEVLREMLTPNTALLSKKWRKAQPGPGEPQGAVILEEAGARGRPHLRLAISSRTGMLNAITQVDAGGQPVMIKKFDDYRDLSRSRRSSRVEQGTAFPYLISFSWPRDRRSMEMHFKQVEGNAPVSDGDFDIAASETTKYLPLNRATMDSSLADDGPVAAAPRGAGDRDAM